MILYQKVISILHSVMIIILLFVLLLYFISLREYLHLYMKLNIKQLYNMFKMSLISLLIISKFTDTFLLYTTNNSFSSFANFELNSIFQLLYILWSMCVRFIILEKFWILKNVGSASMHLIEKWLFKNCFNLIGELEFLSFDEYH